MDCSLPGFSVHGILQARTLEWVAISFSKPGHERNLNVQMQTMEACPQGMVRKCPTTPYWRKKATGRGSFNSRLVFDMYTHIWHARKIILA